MAQNAVLTQTQLAGGPRSMMRSESAKAPGDWLSALRRFVLASALGNLAWEFGQLPLYTVWHEGSTREIIVAAIHCTGGDILIAGASLVATLMIFGNGRWPHARFNLVASTAILGGLAYTIFSEWLNTEIRGSWAYSAWMPTLPLIGAGLSPFLQWIVVPILAFWWVRRPLAAAAVQRGREP